MERRANPRVKEEWLYVDDPLKHVIESNGMTEHGPRGTDITVERAENANMDLSQQRSGHIKSSVPKGENQWSQYPQQDL
ncbi:hypothetical protein GCM10028895_52320 [Pontibacter rugosus]